MSVLAKLKSVLGSNDWSEDAKSLARQWETMIGESNELKGLLANKGFQRIQSQMKSDFKARMKDIVASDPELRAIQHMFIRTVGMKGTEEAIEKMLDEFLDEPIALSTD